MMMVLTSDVVTEEMMETGIYFEELGDRLDVECGRTRGIKNSF